MISLPYGRGSVSIRQSASRAATVRERYCFALLSMVFVSASPPQDCAPCHRPETAAFAKAGMTSALSRASESTVLRNHPKLTASIGNYNYEIAESVYTVSDGKATLRFPIAWAFGKGTTGQTYLFERGGRWYESRVSYYAALNGLDLTLGFQSIKPQNLLEAAGRLTSPKEAAQCFACHATKQTPGIQCDRCHGDLAAHPKLRKLARLTAGEMSDFCGECHRTWSQVAAEGPRGILNVRFQPYRLANSKCYDAEDRRIRCTACHDPHQTVQTKAAAYDAKCNACHTRASKRICKVAKKDCVTCHMPQIELPGAHRTFADHWIRVVRKDAPYPD